MGQLATVIRYGETSRDRLNNPVISEVSRVSTAARVELTGSREDDTYVEGKWRSYFPPTVDIRPGDEIQAAGRTYRVEGEPIRHELPGFPAANHIEALLATVTEA